MDTPRRGFLHKLGCSLLALASAGVVADCLWEPHALKVYRQRVRLSGLPRSFEGLRIAQLTDIHHGPTVSLSLIRQAVRMANELSPDLTVLTGDYVYHGARYIEPCCRALGELRAPLGVFAVLGNHDHWDGAELVRQQMGQAGIALVDNTGRELRRGEGSLYLAGVGDLWEDEQRLEEALAGAPRHGVTILLSHNPDYNEHMDDRRVKLMLCGHTHGGQVDLPLIGPVVLPSRYGRKYKAGLIRDGWKQVYVSRGVGSIIPAIRFRCRPEVTLLTLTSA